MTVAVFVHGVPETEALWDGLRSRLERESIAVSLPGFGCERQAGFPATKDAYTEGLVEQLDTVGEPVDLVGHDWGGILAVRVATAFGDRLHSWVTDASNILHEDYVWHQFAQVWQTPVEGEAALAAVRAMPLGDRVGLFTGLGIPEAEAEKMLAAGDETMDQCILDLYRSAVPNAHADWGTAVRPTSAPGLGLVPADDPFGDEGLARDMASRLGATVEVLPGVGHWWVLQDPARGAEAIERFWSTLA